MDAYCDTRRDHPLSRRQVLSRAIGVLGVVAMMLSLMGVAPVPKGPPVWRDEFDGAIDAAWTWIYQNAGGWDLTEVPGFLRIYASAYPTGEENLLLRTGAQGNFTIETRMLFEPTADFQFAGLVLYQDAGNYLQFGRAYCDVQGVCAGSGLYFDQIAGASFGEVNYATSYGFGEVFLRLEVTGRVVTASFSGDGQDWTNLGQHTLPPRFQINGVGLTASQDYWRAGEPIAADFDYFSFTGDPKPLNPIPAENMVFINPAGFYGTEFVVTPDQSIVLRWGWGTCARGQVTAFIKALDSSYVLEGQGELQGQWGKPREAPNITGCSGGQRKGWVGYWEYALGPMPLGDYTVHSTAVLSHPVTDGYDSNGDGHPDLYSGTFFDTEITIHVRETLATFVAYVPGSVEGYDWPLGHEISLVVNRANGVVYTGVQPSQQRPGGPARASRVLFELWKEDSSIEAGDHIVMTDTVTGLWKDTVVTNLAVTGIDLAARTVTGVSDPASSIWVWLYDREGQEPARDSQSGVWTATFDELPPGAWGGATQWEADGDGTSLDFQVPNPRFSAFPEWEFVQGYDWPVGETVTADIPAEPECSNQGVVPDGGMVDIPLPPGCDLQVGDVVTVTGGQTVRTHTVQNLDVTSVDPVASTISGTADDGAQIYVFQYSPQYHGELMATTEGGIWVVDGSGVLDLIPGAGGRSEIRDPEGNSTAVDWSVPPALSLRVNYGHDWVESFYEAGHTVSVAVSREGSVIATIDLVTEPKDDWGGEPGFRSLDGEWDTGVPDIQPGDWVFATVDNGASAQVQIGDIQGTVDPNTDSVSGMIGIVGYSGGEEVTVECLPWGAPTPAENKVADVSSAGPGMYWYGCSWPTDEWDIQHYQNVGVAYTDPDGNWVANAFFAARTVSQPPFYIEWSRTDPEEIVHLSWKGSANLTNTWHHDACPGDLEYFGNSWVSENEGGETFFFASLVGWGTAGSWTSPAPNEATINSVSSRCPGSADVPVHTEYRFWGNLIEIQRIFEYGAAGYAHDVRPYIPRLAPADGYTQVLHPDGDGDTLLTQEAGSCNYGCRIDDWNGSWFAIHNPSTGQGMIVQHKPSAYSVALWVDQDGGSNTNSSSVLLLQPEGGFVGPVLETEYLCFYDANVPDGGWEPSLILPDGCQP